MSLWHIGEKASWSIGKYISQCSLREMILPVCKLYKLEKVIDMQINCLWWKGLFASVCVYATGFRPGVYTLWNDSAHVMKWLCNTISTGAESSPMFYLNKGTNTAIYKRSVTSKSLEFEMYLKVESTHCAQSFHELKMRPVENIWN